MKFKEFSEWCNLRACDGAWGTNTAIICVDIATSINRLPKREQEKAFQEAIKDTNIVEAINKINERIGDPKRYSETEEEKESFFKKIFRGKKNG